MDTCTHMASQKICKTCKVDKPTSEFRKYRRNSKSGIKYYFQSSCKPCVKEYGAARDAACRADPELRNKRNAKDRNRRLCKKAGVYVKRKLRTYEEVLVGNSEYCKKRRRNDPNYRLLKNLRCSLNHVVRGGNSTCMEALLGISADEFRDYIGAQFKEGMTWENYGTTWQIHHIVPCSSFEDLETSMCFHHTNLQPML